MIERDKRMTTAGPEGGGSEEVVEEEEEEVVEEEEEAERMRGTAKGRGGPLVYHRYACACTTLSVSDYYYIPYILAGQKGPHMATRGLIYVIRCITL